MEKEIIKIIAQNIGGHIPDQKECAKQIYQLFETRIKELEGTIENNVTEVSEFFNDGVEIFECNTCGMLMEANEPYNNYCPNCGRKIKK